MKVVIPQDITQSGKDYLVAQGYQVSVGSGSSDPTVLAQEIAGADAILARTAPYPAQVLSAAPNLKVIARNGAGVDNIDLDYCNARKIQVTFSPTANSITVAEHAVGLMIACAHHFAQFDRGMRAGEWLFRNRLTGFDLYGSTLGIMGLGRIGSHVAQICKAGFGMNVIAYSPSRPADQFPEGCEKVETVDELLPRCDVLSLHVPSTPSTKGFLNKVTLGKMKPSAIVINTSRGDLINIPDFIDALQTGTIAGAGLDVFPVEPPDPNDPLFQLENVIFTPHAAALTHESLDRMSLHAAQGIHDVLSGRTPQWPVNHL